MSIKKNRELMFEQIKRLRGELKESVNEKAKFIYNKNQIILKKSDLGTPDSWTDKYNRAWREFVVRYVKQNNIKANMSDAEYKVKKAFKIPYPEHKYNSDSAYWLEDNGFLVIKESVNEEETKGISKDLMKKIEVVIKRGLGLKKLREVIGPIDGGRFANISKAIFEIGQSSIGMGEVISIKVIKFLGRPIYKAQIDIRSMSDYGLYGYGGYGRTQYSNEADLLKAIFNMVKKEKDKLTAVYNGKSYLKQSYLGFKESVNEKYDGPMTIKVPAGEKLKIGSIIRAEDERGKSILAKVVKHSGKGKRGTNHYTVEPIEDAVKTWKQLYAR